MSQLLSEALPQDTSLLRTRHPHLNYLDGLRGFAALYVAIFHTYTEVNFRWAGGGLPRHVWLASQWMVFGHAAVGIFIVLSGYCLMLPVVRAKDGTLSGGLASFVKRRARRILPPYYAALALSMVMLALTARWQHIPDTYWDYALPGLNLPVIASHIFLVHDWFDYGTRIDPPLWSVAVEWHIYFFFALLLLPVWRRFGLGAAVTVGMGLGLVLPLCWPNIPLVALLFPLYLFLFAMGMAGASINFSSGSHETWLRNRIPWGICLFLLLVIFLLTLKKTVPWLHLPWLDDVRVGLTTMCFLIFCTKYCIEARGNAGFFTRILSAPFAVRLGAFSYSLYLVHQPLEALFYLSLHNFALSPTVRLLVMVFVCLPLVLLCAYLFHLIFEKPFTATAARKPSPLSEAHGLASAPSVQN